MIPRSPCISETTRVGVPIMHCSSSVPSAVKLRLQPKDNQSFFSTVNFSYAWFVRRVRGILSVWLYQWDQRSCTRLTVFFLILYNFIEMFSKLNCILDGWTASTSSRQMFPWKALNGIMKTNRVCCLLNVRPLAANHSFQLRGPHNGHSDLRNRTLAAAAHTQRMG